MNTLKFDESKPYAIITGHETARYEQGGVLFDGQGRIVNPAKKTQKDLQIETDEMFSAKMFLCQILKGGPLSKATVYKAAEGNNQSWPRVKEAADLLKIVRFQYQGGEQWKLPEELSVI